MITKEAKHSCKPEEIKKYDIGVILNPLKGQRK